MSLSRAGLFEGTLFVVAFFTLFPFFLFSFAGGGAPKSDTPKGEGAR